MIATILMGLPLSGKSTWTEKEKWRLIEEENAGLQDIIIVSADVLKENHPKYNPNDTEPLHEWSVKEAENLMYNYAEKKVPFIIMDGGGINRSYTIRIIKKLQEYGYFVRLTHLITPLHVCLNRNKDRERKVPKYAIIEKAAKERTQFLRLAEVVDDVEVVEYFTHKHIFFDMDGVLAGVSTFPKIDGKIDFVNSEFFKHLPPVTQVIEKMKALSESGHNVYILSATPNSYSVAEKIQWLHINCPFLKIVLNADLFFVNSGRHKAEMLNNIVTKMKLNKQDVTLIDDSHATLEETTALEMRAMHPSEFLTYNFS